MTTLPYTPRTPDARDFISTKPLPRHPSKPDSELRTLNLELYTLYPDLDCQAEERVSWLKPEETSPWLA